VGISVEFCAHLVRAFKINGRPTRDERARESLATMGSSVSGRGDFEPWYETRRNQRHRCSAASRSPSSGESSCWRSATRRSSRCSTSACTCASCSSAPPTAWSCYPSCLVSSVRLQYPGKNTSQSINLRFSRAPGEQAPLRGAEKRVGVHLRASLVQQRRFADRSAL